MKRRVYTSYIVNKLAYRVCGPASVRTNYDLPDKKSRFHLISEQ